MTDERLQNYIDALIRERAGYEEKKNADGVAAVDAELARVGAKPAAPAKRATKRTVEATTDAKQSR